MSTSKPANSTRKQIQKPKNGDLRVTWIPQIGANAQFHVNVASTQEVVRVMDLLAKYDLFQYYHKIKPDFANTGFLEQFTDGEWEEWYDEDGEFDSPQEYLESKGLTLDFVTSTTPARGPLE